MDPDNQLAVTTRSVTLTTGAEVPFGVAFRRLPPALRTEVLHLAGLMRKIDGAKSKLAACAMLATKGCSAETLKRWYYGKGKTKGLGWKDIGMAALVDHRRCNGCGLAGCKVEREATLSAETVRIWQAGAINNDKRALTESWKVIMRDLAAGKTVADVGTWRDLFAKVRPFALPPAKCPWSMHRPPLGWGLGSFMKHRPADVLYKLGQKGSFAAWSELPEVRMDLSTLRPFEWLVVDDHRLDFKVFVDVPGRGVQLVELWGLFVMDVATRMIVSFALKPRVMRDDGATMAFEHRDMQHLMAHVIGTYGVPVDFTQTWIVENAAAAVSTECENLVGFVSGGRIKIKRSGIQVGDFSFSGFPERWGNYRGKRWLEAYFGPLDIVLGGVKGQMGSEYWVKPGSFDAREAFGNRLTRLLEKCTPEIRAKLALPFEWAGQAHWLVSDAIELLNHRSDHELEGFPEVRFFAYDRDSQMMPMCPQLAALHGTLEHLETFSKVPDALKELWLKHGGKPRRVTPAEMMQMRMPKLMRLAPEAILDLMFDEITSWKREPLMWRGGDVLDVELRRGRAKQRVRFHGVIPGMEQGQRVIARVNADRIECGLWLLDEKRRFLGWMRYEADPTHEDMEGLERMMGAQIKALGQAKKGLRKITMGPVEARAKIGEMEELTQTMHTMNGRTPNLTAADDEEDEEVIPALPGSRDFVQAVKTRARSGTAKESDAEAYLRMRNLSR